MTRRAGGAGSDRSGVGGAPPPSGPPQPIIFEAALADSGNCFSLTRDGDARFTLSVPASTVAPLALAMAQGRLKDRTFIVTITDEPAKG